METANTAGVETFVWYVLKTFYPTHSMNYTDEVRIYDTLMG